MSLVWISLLALVDIIAMVVSWVVRLFVRKPSQYTTSVFVAAPLPLVWETSTARDITLDGWPPLTLRSRDIPEVPDAFQISFDVFGQDVDVGFRQLERREEDSVLYEILSDYTSDDAILGTDHYAAFGVEAEGRGTRLTSTYRLNDRTILNRVMIPFSMRIQLRRIKRHVEARVDRDSQSA